MNFSQPKHLKCDNPTVDVEFGKHEKIYRRITKKLDDKKDDYFSELSTKEMAKGVSVNRDKFGSDAQDAMWSINEDKNNCLYLLMTGEIVYTTIDNISSNKNESGIKVFCEHSPFGCNCSHCDLKFDPSIVDQPKATKVGVRLFMNTVFQSTGLKNYGHSSGDEIALTITVY